MPASASPTPPAPLVILPGLICDSRMFGETLAAFPESRVMGGFYGGADRIEAMADHVLARMPARAALLRKAMRRPVNSKIVAHDNEISCVEFWGKSPPPLVILSRQI